MKPSTMKPIISGAIPGADIKKENENLKKKLNDAEDKNENLKKKLKDAEDKNEEFTKKLIEAEFNELRGK